MKPSALRKCQQIQNAAVFFLGQAVLERITSVLASQMILGQGLGFLAYQYLVSWDKTTKGLSSWGLLGGLPHHPTMSCSNTLRYAIWCHASYAK